MLDTRLTVILTLKGRPEFTLRWLWHANKTNFPFKVYIADGEVDERIANMLVSNKNFPNVDYEYVRYNDISLRDYYRKCADAAAKIQTPYVMMADNDDFIFVSGVKKSLDFLDSHPGYVCAQSTVSGFAVEAQNEQIGKVIGRISLYQYLYSQSYSTKLIDQESSFERIRSQMERYHITFYSVKRRHVLKELTEELEDLNFTSLELHEMYWAYREASLGKIYSTRDSLYYIRQRHTTLRKPMDWVDSFLSTDYSQEVSRLIDKLATLNLDVARQELLEAFGKRMRIVLRHQYGKRELGLHERLKRKISRKYDPTGKKEFMARFTKDSELRQENLVELGAIEHTLNDQELFDLIKRTLFS